MRLVGSFSLTDENHWQTVAYHIVEIHDILHPVALWQTHESSQLLVGHCYKRIIHLWLLLVLVPFHALYGEEDAVVARGTYFLHLRQPDRIGAAVELF